MLDMEAINGTESTLDMITQEEAVEATMEEFFDLLMAQVTHQDPMNPMEDTEFISQMAQFQALNETKKLRESMDELIATENVAQASSLIGSVITALDTEAGSDITGLVEKVRITDNNPLLILDEGQEVKFENIIEVASLYI